MRKPLFTWYHHKPGRSVINFVCIILIITAYPEVIFSQNKNKTKWLDQPPKYHYTDYNVTDVKLSQEELKLYSLLMDYRAGYGLPDIPLSKALTFVAQTHAGDLTDRYKQNKRCNIHSWSKKGNWTSCCYNKDHSQALCLWNKPRELTNYTGDGFEVAYWHLWSPSADSTFAYLLKSPTHEPILSNRGDWSDTEWKAIGIAIYYDYALIWLGKLSDPDGEPELPGSD